MSDFAQRRRIMVDTQVRPSDVTRFPIIDAMLSVPREAFVPRDKREAAYVGTHIDLGNGRVVPDPRVLAKMLEAADIQPDDLVLDVGAGLGYSIIANEHWDDPLPVRVDGLDPYGQFFTGWSGGQLPVTGPDFLVTGPLNAGAAKHGPYDVILLEGAVAEVPEAITGQLKDGGRIVAIFAEGTLGVVRIGYRIDDAISWRFSFNATAPLLPGLMVQKWAHSLHFVLESGFLS